MRKSIDNHRFDTDAGELLGTYERGEGEAREFEHLYRQSRGRYFLHAGGGSESRYARRTPKGFEATEDIFALSREDAQAWAMEHMEPKRVNSLFGYQAKGKTRLVINCTAGLKRRYKDLSTTAGMHAPEFLEALLDGYEERGGF